MTMPKLDTKKLYVVIRHGYLSACKISTVRKITFKVIGKMKYYIV